MSIKIELENFKRIQDKIILKDLSFVNYLVGKNSSGKSSIINAVSFLKDPTNARRFFNEKSVNRLTHNLTSIELYWEIDNPNKVETKGNLQVNIIAIINNYENEKGANNITKIKTDSLIGVGNRRDLEKFNEFLIEMNHCTLTAKRYFDQSDPFNQDSGTLIFESEIGNIDPTMIADGMRVLYNLRNTLNHLLIERSKPGLEIILIEEPEINMHPDYQKLIPVIFNNIYNLLSNEKKLNTFFIVSTHSPFIIGKASTMDYQKVYPLEDGKLVNINFENFTWEKSTESSGFSGYQCVNIVNRMLGADITDIGYPENYVILEEYSLQIILDDLKHKSIIKNFQFVSFSGIENSIGMSEKINELEKLNTLIKCNPYYFDKYLIITDSTTNLNTKVQSRVEKLKRSINSRFIELKEHSLEDYYKNVDLDIFQRYHLEIAETNKNMHGLIKAKYAREIVEKINDKNSFQKLFKNELDILLK